jgi:hypothetical protein
MSIIQTDQLTKYYGKARGIIEVSSQEDFSTLPPEAFGKLPVVRAK